MYIYIYIYINAPHSDLQCPDHRNLLFLHIYMAQIKIICSFYTSNGLSATKMGKTRGANSHPKKMFHSPIIF